MLSFLSKQKVWVFDGAMGTMIQTLSSTKYKCPEELNLTNPNLIKHIHSLYIKEGSDLIQTNTFGANFLILKSHGLENKTYEINKIAVQLARDVAKDKIVVASIGPTGRLIEPRGKITKEEVFNAYLLQAKGLDEADFINLETVQSLEEAEIIITAIRSVLNLPISVTITFQKSNNGFFTKVEESIEDFVNWATKWNVDLIGTNCGEGFQQSLEIISKMNKMLRLPLIAKPSAGLPIFIDDKIVYPETPDFIEPIVIKLFENNVKILGGCCGTTPEHIKVIKRIANRINFS